MSISILKKLRETVMQIEAERDKLEQQARSFREVISYYESLGDDNEIRVNEPKALANALYTLLERFGRPVHYRQLADELVKQNFPIPGKDPARNVNAHLSLDERFETNGAGLWGLRRWIHLPKSNTQDAPRDDETEVPVRVAPLRPDTKLVLATADAALAKLSDKLMSPEHLNATGIQNLTLKRPSY